MRKTFMPAALLMAVPLLAACGEDEPADPTAPVEIELGEAFTWNELHVAEGWSMKAVKPQVGMEQFDMPVLAGMEATNEGEAAKPAAFEVVFAREGTSLAEINCVSPEIAPGESMPLDCTGFGQKVPQGQDTIVVRKITR